MKTRASFKQTVIDLLRRWLRSDVSVGGDAKYRTPTFSSGVRPGVDLTKALALASAMDDEEPLRNLSTTTLRGSPD